MRYAIRMVVDTVSASVVNIAALVTWLWVSAAEGKRINTAMADRKSAAKYKYQVMKKCIELLPVSAKNRSNGNAIIWSELFQSLKHRHIYGMLEEVKLMVKVSHKQSIGCKKRQHIVYAAPRKTAWRRGGCCEQVFFPRLPVRSNKEVYVYPKRKHSNSTGEI